MGEANALIDEAAKMPLPDAAYALWRARRELDAREGAGSRPRPRRAARPDASDAFMASVRDAIQAARDERTQAPDGPTFHRLKSAHPEASDAELRAAIRAAVKLEADCTRYYSRNGASYSDDIEEAVRLARLDNPGFSEATYKRLFDYMAFVMK